jgi:hypothetical protein
MTGHYLSFFWADMDVRPIRLINMDVYAGYQALEAVKEF